jgi:hypothetical protein
MGLFIAVSALVKSIIDQPQRIGFVPLSAP